MKRSLACAAALMFGACGGDGGGVASSDPFCQQVLPVVSAFMAEARADNPVPSDERYGGTAVAGGAGELAGGMNVAGGMDYSAVQHHQFVNLMTLLDYDADGTPRPYLAESWEISEDNTEITWHIRQDVMWHDGEQTDAHDVAFTFAVVTDPATAFPNSSYWDHYEQGSDAIEIVDDFTIKMRLRPHADFLDPWRSVAIMPEHLLGDVPHDEIGAHPYGSQCPVGNGPFVFDSHDIDDRWIFTANPVFPEALGGRPFLDRYIYRMIPEQTTLLTELLTDNLEIYIKVRPDQAEQIIDAPSADLLNFTFRNYVMVVWNARRPQFADSRVRRAITMATNRPEIVQAIQQGYGIVANSSVPPFHWAYDDGPDFGTAYDRAGASALLDEAGWQDRDGDGVRENADGLPLEFSIKYNTGNRQRQNIAEIMQTQLSQVGITATPEVVDFPTLLGQINSPEREFDGVGMGWVVEYKLDDMNLFHSERIDQPFAWSGTNNAEIDRLLDELSFVVDRDEAIQLWSEYQRALDREHPYTFFYYPDQLDGVSKRLKGVTADARGEWVSVRGWYLDPASR